MSVRRPGNRPCTVAIAFCAFLGLIAPQATAGEASDLWQIMREKAKLYPRSSSDDVSTENQSESQQGGTAPIMPPRFSKIVIEPPGSAEIYGFGLPGTDVSVSVSGRPQLITKVEADGRWRAAIARGFGPGEYRITTSARRGKSGTPVAGQDVRIRVPAGYAKRITVQYDGGTRENADLKFEPSRAKAEALAEAASQEFSDYYRRGERSLTTEATGRMEQGVPTSTNVLKQAENKILSVGDRLKDWLARANRGYQSEVARRLSVPTGKVPGSTEPAAGANLDVGVKSAEGEMGQIERDSEHRQMAEAEARKRLQAEEAQRATEDEHRAIEAQRAAQEVRQVTENARREADEKAQAEAAWREAEKKQLAEDAERRRADAAKLAEAQKREADTLKRLASEQKKAQEALKRTEAQKRQEQAKRDAEEEETKERLEALAAEALKKEEAKRLAEEAKRRETERQRLTEEAEKAARVASATAELAKREAEQGKKLEDRRAQEEEVDRLAADLERRTERPVDVGPRQTAPAEELVSKPQSDGEDHKAVRGDIKDTRQEEGSAEGGAGDVEPGTTTDLAPRPRSCRIGKTKRKGRYISYVVKPGDTLWAISERYLGRGEKFTFIHHANPELIDNPDFIVDCQRIKIPMKKRKRRH